MVRSLKMRMPAEFEKHFATWLVWPSNKLTFPDGTLEKVKEIYENIVKEISKSETVQLVVKSPEELEEVKGRLNTANVRFNIINARDVWVRDYGPTFTKENEGVSAVKWKFNAWGNKYTDLLDDNITGLKIARKATKSVYRLSIVLEGGAIEINGKGLCICTKSSVLNSNRNPRLSEASLLKILKKYLGVKKIFWLESNLPGDDTDGHIDNVARFVDNETIVTVYSQEPEMRFTRLNLKKLKELRKVGEVSDVYTIPIPETKCNLPCSYANFYITNSSILVPVFDDKNDDRALSIIQSLTKRKVVPINCRPLLEGFGGIHCITQQQPY